MLLKKLQSKKYRDLEQLFIIEGEHLVEEAFKAGVIKELYVLDGYCYEYETTINYVTLDVMKKITSLESIPNIIGLCYIKKKSIVGNNILLLDNIQDPGNLGTIIRNAVAFNVDTIILSNDTVDLYNAKVLRSAQGMNFNINIVIDDLVKTIIKLKNEDYYIYSTSLKDKNELDNIIIKPKFGLVVGNEGNGIREDILKLCDENIYIKMNPNCESLNVGVATGIVLYKISR